MRHTFLRQFALAGSFLLLAAAIKSDFVNRAAPNQRLCVIQNSGGQPVTNNNDPLAKFLMASGPCPTDVFEFRRHLISGGAKLRPTMVANRGFHNPTQGSFSLFEIISLRSEQRSPMENFSSGISPRRTGQRWRQTSSLSPTN
jgi:hypothetical protein